MTGAVQAPVKTYRCGVDASLAVLGGKWKLLLLYHLLDRPRRHGELRRLVPEISQKVLTQQLRELEADGLVRRTVVQQRPLHVDYAVSDDARPGLEAVVDAVAAWGLAWVAETGGRLQPVEGCGEDCGG